MRTKSDVIEYLRVKNLIGLIDPDWLLEQWQIEDKEKEEDQEYHTYHNED